MNANQRRKMNRKKMMKRSADSPYERRAFTGHVELRDQGDTIRAALSSETPVKRAFGTEVLDHSPGAVDLSRAAKGLPLIVQHDHHGALPVGRVRDITLDPDRVLRGTLHFSARAEAQTLRQDVLDEIVTDVSLGYTVDRNHVKKTGDTFRFGKFTPLEVSLVSVPADPNAGINRTEDPPMEPTPTPTPAEDPIAPVTDELAIRQNFERFTARDGVADLQTRVLAEGKSEADAMKALLDHLGNAGSPPKDAAGVVIVQGEDAHDKFSRAAENAILVRSGIANAEEEKDGKENPLTSYSMVALARQWAELNNIDIAGMSPQQLIGRAIDPGTANLAQSDFTDILANVLNKGLFRGFDEASRTWDSWCSVGSVADFKQYSRPGLSHFTTLAVVAENAAIADGIRTDKTEVGTLRTFARKLSITREAMVSDDLSAFADNARAMGEAAQRTIDVEVYTVLQANAVMNEDAVALFSVLTHANLVTVGAAPDEAGIIAAEVAMSAQVDQNSIPLGITPAFSLAPIELKRTMEKLASAEFSPDGSANPFEPNAVRGSFIPLATHLITDKNSWYMMGARGSTLEVNFLNGQRSPSMERDTGWSTLSSHWKVFLDFHVLPLDWRAAYLNEGGA